MNEETNKRIENTLLVLKDFYGAHNTWGNFEIVLKSEMKKLAEDVFVQGQEDVIKPLTITCNDEEKENAFDVLMSCMPKSAENINTITPEDARKMLQDFVKKYWYKDD